MENLKAKIFITGKIVLKTGLHIGGSSTALDIGGIDNSVIKTAKGIPYIPGSSLKGKLRTLYSRINGYEGIRRPKGLEENSKAEFDEDDEILIKVFGIGAKENKGKGKKDYTYQDGVVSRLIVRDAFLDEEHFDNNKEELFPELELLYTEGKWENTIDRIKSSATPRQIERIPAGMQFKLKLVYDIYDNKDLIGLKLLFGSFRLLEDDYLGGSGTRGYGKIKFDKLEYIIKDIGYYKTGKLKEYCQKDSFKHSEIEEKINNILKKCK